MGYLVEGCFYIPAGGCWWLNAEKAHRQRPDGWVMWRRDKLDSLASGKKGTKTSVSSSRTIIILVFIYFCWRDLELRMDRASIGAVPPEVAAPAARVRRFGTACVVSWSIASGLGMDPYGREFQMG
jgi:hypothetical protein